MKAPVLEFQTVVSNPRAGTRHVVPASRNRKGLLILLAAMVFVAMASTGLSTVAQVSQIPMQILFEVGRMAFAALQIFGR
jgi:hypothetical protein